MIYILVVFCPVQRLPASCAIDGIEGVCRNIADPGRQLGKLDAVLMIVFI
jgi:hypothetical protein